MWEDMLILSIAGFLAAATDAIAGGGGLISLPALLLAGAPPHLALGTNKFASTTGSFTGAMTFSRSGKLSVAIVSRQAPFTLAGAAIGVLAVMRLDPNLLSAIVPGLMLAVGLYTVLRPNIGIVARPSKRHSMAIGCAFAAALGFYDGFFGPGTGSFLIFAFVTVFGQDFVVASANAKALNFVSNFTSLLMFALHGQIDLTYGIAMAVFMIIGARVGARLALSKGVRLVKPVFITMSMLVAIKLIYESRLGS